MVTSASYDDPNLDHYNAAGERVSQGERCSASLFSESGWSDSVIDSPRITTERDTRTEEKEGLECSLYDDLLCERKNDNSPARRRNSAGKLLKAATAPEGSPKDTRPRRYSGQFQSAPARAAQASAASGDKGEPRPQLKRRGSTGSMSITASRQKADDEVCAVNNGRPRRASNAPLLSVPEKEQPDRQNVSPSPAHAVDAKLGFEWMARLQGCEESKQREKDACRQILWHVDEAGLDITKLQSFEKINLDKKIVQEIDGLLSYMLKQAFDNVSADEEELASLRKTVQETEDRISSMNRAYLQEISSQRDKFRCSEHVVHEALEKAEEGGHVEFYEPLRFLSPECRSTVLAILDEKIKAIFAFNPDLKERTNQIELAKFEDAVRDDRLKSYEKMNSNLRDENRELRSKIQKTSAILEKHEWELHAANKKISELEAALAEAKEKPESNDAEVQCEELASEEAEANGDDKQSLEKQVSPSSSASSPPKTPRSGKTPNDAAHVMAVSTKSGAVKSATPRKELDRYDVGVQADLLTERRPSLVKRKSSFENFLMAGDNEFEGCASGKGGSGDLGVQLNKARREVDTAKKSLQQRDLNLRRLESELHKAQEKNEQLEAELRAHQDLQALQEAVPGISSRSVSKEQARKDVEQDAQRIQSLEEELERAQNETQVARHQARTLRADLEAARQANVKAEKRRLELVKGAVSEEVSGELDDAIQNKNALFEELEQTKAAFSMVLSRNATLEMAVAALNAEGEQKPTPEPKSRPRASPNPSHTSATMDNDQLCNLMSQRGELREKVSIQKAQLQAVLQENTTLHLALQEMQQEVQHLTKQLRNAVPDIEVMNADLEAVLGRMDKVVRDGGGGYMRLHKEAKLREIASEARATRRAEEATAEAAAASQEVKASQAVRNGSTSPSNTRAPPAQGRRGSAGGAPLRNSKVEPLAPVSPPPTAVGPRRASGLKTWSSSATSPKDANKPKLSVPKQQSEVASVKAGVTEQRGSIGLGSKGGMAILGGR